MLCIVAKWHILQQKCMNKWIGSAPLGTRRYNFQPPMLTLSPQTPHTQNFEILFIYYMLLSWSRDHFINVTMKTGQYCIISRWWLINAPYTVQLATSATAGLLVYSTGEKLQIYNYTTGVCCIITCENDVRDFTTLRRHGRTAHIKLQREFRWNVADDGWTVMTRTARRLWRWVVVTGGDLHRLWRWLWVELGAAARRRLRVMEHCRWRRPWK